jgi:hypothetical protein
VVDPHQYVTASVGDVGDTRRCAIAPITQQQIAARHWDAPEGLTPMSIGDLEKVALQIRQVDTEVNAPVCAMATGPANGSGIDGADAVAFGRRRCGVLLPKLVGHPTQPLLSGAKPLEQGHSRDITPTGLPGVRGCFLE